MRCKQSLAMSFEYVQENLKYKFANAAHLDLALKAAHKSDLDGTADDGNRGLSQMGLSVMEMVEIHNTVFVEKGTSSKFCCINFIIKLSKLELANARQSWTRSKQGRAKACKDLGLHQHIVCSVRQHHEEPSSTVLANGLSAIIGAIWIDMQEQNRSVSDTIQQISTVLRYIDSVVANEQTFGNSMSLDGSFPALEANERGTESLVQSQLSYTLPSETYFDTNNPLDLSATLSWGTEAFQGSAEVQTEPLRIVEPASLCLGEMSPTFDLALLEHAQGELHNLRR